MAAEPPTPSTGLRRAVEQLVLLAVREVQLLGTLTPLEAHRERARLVEALQAGRDASPRWTYARVAHDDLRRTLDAAADALAEEGETPLDHLYRDRLRELSLEAELCAAAGTAELSRLARARFAAGSAPAAREASQLCKGWLEEPAARAPAETVASDDPDPRSLLSRMRAEVGRLRLPFTVVAQPSLAPLAATGDGVILVAPGRRVADEDAARTVLHEIEGHARPRARAREVPCPLFRAGTAGGVDDQEGRALLLEERAGLLGSRRRRQLAARHQACEAMADGATFADVTTTLTRVHGLDALQAVVV
ncbi:MAG: tyrosine/phenylalanine carboxypeptidase domain-containing protein, partial [Polyangiaceae bacterium]